jgi:hypothetical protein
MIRHPYGPDELDRTDPELDGVAEELERYAAARSGEPPLDLAARIQAAVDDEPDPSAGWSAFFTAGLRGLRGPARAVAVAAVVVAAIVGALALGDLAERARQDSIGASSTPSPVGTPTSTPSATPSATPSPSPSASPTASPSQEPTTSPSPTASDDDDEIETPEPDGSDNSGPGGGDDNSGPGGGDDNSGPGGGG